MTVAATTIDLSPVLTPLLQLAGLVLTGVASWALGRVAQHFRVATQSALFQNVLGAVDRGIAFGQQTVQADITAHGQVAVSNAVQAQAVQYVVDKLPGTLKALDITPAHVADLVLAKLPPPDPVPAPPPAAVPQPDPKQ
jgi:hypothetical protein